MPLAMARRNDEEALTRAAPWWRFDRPMSQPPVQILGAGLTGMSAAYHLGDDCEVHEKQRRAGGHVVTDEDRGFRFDRTGHLLHLRDPDISSWVKQLLGEDALQISRRSRVFSHGTYTRYPYQANTFGLPPAVAYECLMGFLEALARREQMPEPASLEDYFLKFFGAGFSRHFMVPYNTKLWGVHPREITADWCSRFVPLPTLEDVIAGAVGLGGRELGYNATFTYPRRGIGTLSDAMRDLLGSTIRLGSAPRSIDWRAKRLIFEDRAVPYSVLISSAPLNKLVALLSGPPPEIIAAAAKLRCNGLYYLDVALDVPCGVDLHWAYVPEERFPFYRVGCYSNFSAEMAPEAKANLYVELSSRSPPDLRDLSPQIVQGLVEMGLVRSSDDVLFMRLRHMEHAYVVFDHEYYGALACIQDFLTHENILSAGRYGGWNYSSMEDALIYGREAAVRARALIG
ncbi:MAG: FAD-dependent oxidoreductase [Proteobacteria bacterium]|nr:FAD-dependent oxidoreductase [Pseudomonadota bacterium]